MGTIKKNEVVLGIYDETTFHYVFNHNNRFMINATEIAIYLKIDLSEYLRKETTKRYIDLLLKQKPTLTKFKIDGEQYETMMGKNNNLEDVIIIEKDTYYFHDFLIHDLLKPFLEFYFWFDDIGVETRRALSK